ncbi:MAG: cupin domain-containing protein [Actinomycetota bacterium]
MADTTTTDTSFDLAGWAFADAGAIEWQPMGEGVAMKMLAAADGKVIALFKFEPGYVGGTHHHEEAEFTYVLEGDLISNGVAMAAGHAYGAQAGTDHEEFRTDGGATLVSVFKLPG